MVNWSQESILVTGGTGSFGKKFVEIMQRDYQPQRLVVFSRDELKQHEMRTSGFDHPSLRYFIGDVRDVERLKRALAGFLQQHPLVARFDPAPPDQGGGGVTVVELKD